MGVAKEKRGGVAARRGKGDKVEGDEVICLFCVRLCARNARQLNVKCFVDW